MIIVYVETDASGATEMSREAITFARDLSAAGGGVPIDALVVGELPEGLVTQLGQYGVRHVHHAVGDAFAAYSGAAWAAALQAARETAGSVVVTASGTPRGMEILAHVAARLGVPMAANVISFGGLSPFVVTRQVLGGAVREEMKLDQRPAVFTVAGHAVEAGPAEQPTAAELVEFKPEVAEADLVARVVSREAPPRPPCRLADAGWAPCHRPKRPRRPAVLGLLGLYLGDPGIASDQAAVAAHRDQPAGDIPLGSTCHNPAVDGRWRGIMLHEGNTEKFFAL